MLRRFRQLNVRSHQDTTLNLQPLTLLVGPAGAGKSNIFKGLVMLQSTIHRPPAEIFGSGLGEFQWVRSRWAKETDPMGFEVEVELEGMRAVYRLQFAEAPQGVYIYEETLQRHDGKDWAWVFQQRWNGKPNLGEFGAANPYGPTVLNRVWRGLGVTASAPGVKFARSFAQSLSRVAYFHLEASSLKDVGELEPARRIKYYGAGLPEFIAWAKAEPDPKIYASIRDDLRQVLPHLEEIVLNPVSGGRQGVAMSFKDQRGFVTALDLSDGTMLSLGLLAIVHSPERPELLCIEEPETGFHPRRIRWLFDKLMDVAWSASAERPCQVLLTTHSPYLVDLFKDMQEAVNVVDHSEGRSRISKLTEIKAKLHEQSAGDPIGHEWAMGLFEGL